VKEFTEILAYIREVKVVFLFLTKN